MSFINYHFGLTKVTAQIIDTNNSEYLWIAFDLDSGQCILRKVSARNLNQVYYEVVLPVDRIVRLTILGGNIFAAVEHDTLMGYRISLTNPLTSQSAINRTAGVNENPVDIANDGSSLWWLFPGEGSEFSKLIKTDTDGFEEETVVLNESGDEIHDASCMSVIDDSNIWISTDTSPARLVRVYDPGTGFTYSVYELTP